MIIYCATTNAGKIAEFQAASGPLLQFLPLPELRYLPPSPETGATFEENAIQKGIYYSRNRKGLVIAEDSGLAVNALHGAPGIYSARFAGEGATDEENNLLLLDRMKEQSDRRASYVCAIALLEDGKLLEVFRGEVEGEILRKPVGSGGFGYDPLFFYPPFGQTFAQISKERKQQVSHRGRAIDVLTAFMRSHFRPAAPGG